MQAGRVLAAICFLIREWSVFQISNLLRALLAALSLGLISPVLTLCESPSSIPAFHQSTDEETVRALTLKDGVAIAAGELNTMRQLWDPRSPNLASRLRIY